MILESYGNFKFRITIFLAIFLFSIILCFGAASAATINVNNNTPNAIGNAISTANSGDTLNLAAGTYNEYNLTVDKDLTIKGPKTTGTPTAIVDGKGSTQVGTIFLVDPGVTLNLKYLTLRNAYNHWDYGGAIANNQGTVTVSNCYLSSNTGDYYGGGIYNYMGTVLVSNTIFYQNAAYSSGGAIDNQDGVLIVADCKFIGNHAAHGGAICNSGEISITNCEFTDNSATYGAGINNDGKMTITYCVFKENEANAYGNAIWNYDGAITDRKVHFCSFLDTNSGYEIYAETGSVNAEYNWWGSNDDPSARIHGDVDVTPWITDITGAPTITSTNPKNGATNVSASQNIIITFNEFIKKGSNFWIELKNSAGELIPFNSSISGRTLVITPNSDLSESKYRLILHTGCVTDFAGTPLAVTSFSFTVGTPPTITSTSPLNGATNVHVAKTITVTFSEAIRKSSHFWVELVDSTGNAVAFTSYITGGNMLVIDPTGNLAAGTTYKVKLHTGCVTDLVGNPVAPYIFSFTTRNT